MTEISDYAEFLKKNGTFTYHFRGKSMMPLLRQKKDHFTVKAKGPERCRKYDVVLYRRPHDRYVLHRVIKVRENDYVIRGDNCAAKEYGITDNDILGIMTGYLRNGKKHSVNETGYADGDASADIADTGAVHEHIVISAADIRGHGKRRACVRCPTGWILCSVKRVRVFPRVRCSVSR